MYNKKVDIKTDQDRASLRGFLNEDINFDVNTNESTSWIVIGEKITSPG